MNRKALVATLDLVRPALADNALVKIFTCFMFDGGVVTAFNDRIGIVGPATGNTDAFAVDGVTFLNLLKNTEVEDIDLKLDKEAVVIKAGKGGFKLPYFDKAEFIFEVPSLDPVCEVTLDDMLIQALTTCLETTSSDMTMQALMGVCFKFEKDLTLYSCDGDAITKCLPKSLAKGKGTYMVPSEFCRALIKVWQETERKGPWVTIQDGWAIADMENGYSLYGRLIENDNPLDHEVLIQNTLDGEVEFYDLPLGLDEALARARVLADPESAPTLLTVKGGKLQMLTTTHMGDVRDVLTLKGHPDVEAKVHASLVQRSASICPKLSILSNCTAYEGDRILQVVSNVT